ncbi:MAG: hypothetical protein PHZ00_03615 [Candidatus Peribacteraceae bacterium]|nr:hypothetical protein [Candidatus Peribacteraceae bacterium]
MAVVVLSQSGPSESTPPHATPLPFDAVPSPFLAGKLTDLGTTSDNRAIVDITFDDGETSHGLGVNALTFVLTPSDPAAFSAGAPLSAALTPGKRFYGYKYTSKDALTERDAAAQAETATREGRQSYYADRFPGTFFAPAAVLADETSAINTFKAQKSEPGHELQVSSVADVTLDTGARYLIIAEEEGTTVTARGLTWCGDGIMNNGEGCDGNGVGGETCRNEGGECRECECIPGLAEIFFADWVRFMAPAAGQPASYKPVVDYLGDLWSIGAGTSIVKDGTWQMISNAPEISGNAMAENGDIIVSVGGKENDLGTTILIKNSWENVFRASETLPEPMDESVSALWFRSKFWVAGARSAPQRDILLMKGNGSGSFLGDFSIVGAEYAPTGNVTRYTPPFTESRGKLIVFTNRLWFIGLTKTYSSGDGNTWKVEADSPWHDSNANEETTTVLPFVWQGKLLAFYGSESQSAGDRLYVSDNGKEWQLVWLPERFADMRPASVIPHRRQLWIADRETTEIPAQPVAWCGNSRIDPGETCDRENLSGRTCLTEGLHGRQLRCHLPKSGLECTLDTSACSALPETPAVTVGMLPLLSQSVPAGGRDIPVARYQLTVHRPITLNALRLDATADDPHIINGASLWMDTDRDGVLDRIAGWNAVSPQVFFQAFGQFTGLATLTAGTYTLEVRADICLQCTATALTLTPLNHGTFFEATETGVGPALWDGTVEPIALAVTRGRCNNNIVEPPEECEGMNGISCPAYGSDGGMIWCTDCFIDTDYCTWSEPPETVKELDTRTLGINNQVSADFRPNSFQWSAGLKMFALGKSGGKELNGDTRVPATGTIRGVPAGNFNVWIQWDPWTSSNDRTTQHPVELNGHRKIVNMVRPPRQVIPGQDGTWDLLGCVSMESPGFVEIRVPQPLNPTATVYFDNSTAFPSKVLLTRMTSVRNDCIAAPEYLGEPPAPQTYTADIEIPGQGAQNGRWEKRFHPAALGGSYLTSPYGGATAFWRFAEVPKGTYDIFGTWQPISNAIPGQFIVEGGIFNDFLQYLGKRVLRYDSGIEPSGITEDGVQWEKLGQLILTRTDNVVLKIHSLTPGSPFSADAMRLVPVGSAGQ